MYLVSKKHSRKTKRNKCARHRAKIKAKNARRRGRVNQLSKK